MIWTTVNSEPITVERSILVERGGKIGQVSVIRDMLRGGRISFGKTVYEETNQLDEFDEPILKILDDDAEIVN